MGKDKGGTVDTEQKLTPEEKKQWHHEYRKKMRETNIMDLKPHLLPYLVKLGFREEDVKKFNVGKAYFLLYTRMRKKLPKRKCRNVQLLYWLWTHGIAFDALKDFTTEEAKTMLEMIWAKNRQKQVQAA